MATQNRTEPLKLGTVVKIRDSGYGPATIVEFRGPLGPKSRGIEGILQEMLIKAQGDEWSFPESLAAAMNKLQPESGTGVGGKWEGAWVDTIHSPRQTFESLSKRGSFITSLKSFGSESHMVVIDGIDEQGRIVVRDPWEGTRYAMEWETFESVWQGMSVWWSGKGRA